MIEKEKKREDKNWRQVLEASNLEMHISRVLFTLLTELHDLSSLMALTMLFDHFSSRKSI